MGHYSTVCQLKVKLSLPGITSKFNTGLWCNKYKYIVTCNNHVAFFILYQYSQTCTILNNP